MPPGGGPIVPPRRRRSARPGWFSLPPMRYPTLYAWFVFLSSLDIMLTWVVLQAGGREENPLADDVISRHGLTGMIIFKFCLMLGIIVMCEVVGRRRDAAGRRLAKVCVAVTAIPIVAAFAQLWPARHDLPQAPAEGPDQVSVTVLSRPMDPGPHPDASSPAAASFPAGRSPSADRRSTPA